MKINAGIIGATGYAGAELTRLLLAHPDVTVAAVGSKSFAGKPLSEVYPAFRSFTDLVCEADEAVIDRSDVIFACLPHGLSEDLAAAAHDRGKIFIDLGADFRLKDENTYEKWYGAPFKRKDLHEKAVYALPELFRDEIRGKRILANPGCYPTGAALALFPALQGGLVRKEGIVIDSKSGVTGAGREPTRTNHFAELNESFAPYKVAAHRHTPEIEQTLTRAAGENVKITFVPHLLPVNRGILSTIYADAKDGIDAAAAHRFFADFYAGEPFVRVLPLGQTANIKHVCGTNLCDISLHFDAEAGKLILVSAIDNMVKGAAGQAVQNMNLLFGRSETAGLRTVPRSF